VPATLVTERNCAASLPGPGFRVPGEVVGGVGGKRVGERGDGGEEAGEVFGMVPGCLSLTFPPRGVGACRRVGRTEITSPSGRSRMPR